MWIWSDNNVGNFGKGHSSKQSKQESTLRDLSDYQQNISIKIAELENNIDKLEFDHAGIENRLKKIKSENVEQRLALTTRKKQNKEGGKY